MKLTPWRWVEGVLAAGGQRACQPLLCVCHLSVLRVVCTLQQSGQELQQQDVAEFHAASSSNSINSPPQHRFPECAVLPPSFSNTYTDLTQQGWMIMLH